MYINKVEDLIDKLIDDFFTNIILKNQTISKIMGEKNFIKYQKKINEIVNIYIESIPKKYINDITNKKDSYDMINDIIKRYIMIYLYLYIGIFFGGSDDMYINNLVEFSRNQPEFELVIDNFFNSESNALVIKLYYICNNILILSSKNNYTINAIYRKPYSEQTIEFIDSIGIELAEISYNLDNLNNNKREQAHNIIKTLIILNVYIPNDKRILYDIIESTDLSNTEYMYIDIIEPISELINFTSIENLLSVKDVEQGLAYEIWNYLEHLDMKSKYVMTDDDKIKVLIDSGYIVPILDDFLLYHMDVEKYEDTTQISKKKKEDTRNKYIINKIDMVTELYSKKDSDNDSILKIFSNILYPRKAIIYNNVENIKIINKYKNQIIIKNDSIQYINSLINYMKYPYINFKDFEKYGFSHYFTKTTTSVRAVSFDKKSRFKQLSINNKLQLRVGTKNSMGNIVGFMIPTNKKSIQCVKLSELIDIRTLSKTSKNGMNIFTKCFKKYIIENKPHKSSLYWLFDLKYDGIETPNETNVENSQTNIKIMLGHMYDTIVKDIYNNILNKIDSYKSVSIQNVEYMIKRTEKRTINYKLSDNIYNDIEKYVYINKLQKIDGTEITEQLESDLLYGLEGDMISLPVYKKKSIPEDKSTLIINLSKITELGEVIKLEEEKGICQHNITWENISILRKKDKEEYIKRLYEYLKQYVTENTVGDYVCISCGLYLDILKTVKYGSYDESGNYISSSMPIYRILEEEHAYSKYSFTIKIMDKNIEKIVSSVGMPYFVGTTTQIKSRRQEIIKNVIDMVSQNNSLLSNKNKKRNETKYNRYGIIQNQSILFIFSMDNNIYQTSTRDKDQEQYKIIKRNNISVYILIYLLFELNETHISFFNTDKKGFCDIKVFDKIYKTLFGGLKIKKNNTDETYDVVKYKLLCYIMYMISCRIAKHRMWYLDLSSETNINKLIPIIQRRIVNTTIDIINSILENSYDKKSSYIFEIFRVQFHTKMNTIFNNNNYYDKLLQQSVFNYTTARKRNHITLISDDNIPPLIFNNVKWVIEHPQKYYTPYITHKLIDINGVSNLTFCSDGNIHQWEYSKNNKFVCGLCKSKITELKYNQKESNTILEKYRYLKLNKLAQIYCLSDNDIHVYVYDQKTKHNICKKCKKTDNYMYSVSDIEKIKKLFINNDRYSRYIKTTKYYNNIISNDDKYIKKVVNKTIEHMNTSNGTNYIEKFIDKIQGMIGGILKGVNPIYLKNNVYIIDHDYTGNDLGGKEIIITDPKDINIRHNHTFFKRDVIYYTDKRGRRKDIYYDAVTKYLIGYKEVSSNYVTIDNTSKRLKIILSLQSKLNMMGYKREYNNIQNDIKILQGVCSNRLNNLKRTILEFQRIFNSILNKKLYEIDDKEENYFSNKLNIIINKYINKFTNIRLTNKDGKGKIFKHWKGISNGIYIDKFKDININSESGYIYANDVNKYDEKSNIILYYIVEQLTNLIEYNKDSFIKTNLVSFIVEFINACYDRYNDDYIHHDPEINKFIYILKSTHYLKEIYDTQTETDSDTELSIEEIEENIDIKETQDSIDIDTSFDDIDI